MPCPVHKRGDYGRNGWDWQRIRAAVLKRDGGRCQLGLPGCTEVATTADHIIGVAKGGTSALSNLRASCQSCNQQRAKEQARA